MAGLSQEDSAYDYRSVDAETIRLSLNDSPYVYRAIEGENEFRVLELQSSPSNAADISCRLLEVPFDSVEEYDAVSYSWEGQSADRSIFCEGKDLDVTANVEAILRRFPPIKPAEVRLLWIDAICINQQDENEKAVQIASMDRIYKNAREVLIWLGNGKVAKASVRAFRWFKDFVGEVSVTLRKQSTGLEPRAGTVQLPLKLSKPDPLLIGINEDKLRGMPFPIVSLMI